MVKARFNRAFTAFSISDSVFPKNRSVQWVTGSVVELPAIFDRRIRCFVAFGSG